MQGLQFILVGFAQFVYTCNTHNSKKKRHISPYFPNPAHNNSVYPLKKP